MVLVHDDAHHELFTWPTRGYDYILLCTYAHQLVTPVLKLLTLLEDYDHRHCFAVKYS